MQFYSYGNHFDFDVYHLINIRYGHSKIIVYVKKVETLITQ